LLTALDPARFRVVVMERPSEAQDELRRLLANGGALLFETVDAFDAWRSRLHSAGMIGNEVDLALSELCCDRRVLPRMVRCALDALAARECVPGVKALVPPHIAERTFYRRWISCVPRRPKQFLERVRMLHALRMIEAGTDTQDAAFRAGYYSHAQFRKAVRAQMQSAPQVRD
jgi:hypothetical protein